jgi:hypothetical protein
VPGRAQPVGGGDHPEPQGRMEQNHLGHLNTPHQAPYRATLQQVGTSARS